MEEEEGLEPSACLGGSANLGGGMNRSTYGWNAPGGALSLQPALRLRCPAA